MVTSLINTTMSHLSRSLRRLNRLSSPLLGFLSNTFSSTPLPPFTPLLASPSPSLTSTVTSAFSQWFLSHSQNSSNSLLDRIYVALASSKDEHTLDQSLSSLNIPLSETFLLSFLSRKPILNPPIADPNQLLELKLSFFDWSGRRTPYRHSRSVYLSVFLLLKKSNKSPVILQWLQRFTRSNSPSSFPNLYPGYYDTLVIGYAVAGKPETALGILGRMRFSGLDLDPFTMRVLLNSLVENSLFSFCDSLFPLLPPTDTCAVSIRLKSLCMQNDLNSAESLLRSLPSQLASRAFSAGALLNAFCRSGKFHKARKIVEDFPSGEVYTVWIDSLLKKGKLNQALGFLADKKVTEDFIPASPVYNTLIMRLLRENRLHEVYDLLTEMMEEGIPPTRVTMSAALQFFCKAGLVDVALELYRSRCELGIDPGGATYDDLVRALCADGNSDRAYSVVQDAMRKGHFPHHQAFSSLANTLCREGKLDQVRTLLDAAAKQEIRPAADIRARYLTALCKAGNLTEARLDPHVGKGSIYTLESNYKNKSTYVSMIRAFALLGWVEMLPRLMIEMQEMGHIPSRNLYRTVIVSLCKAKRDGVVLELLSQQLQRRDLDVRTCYHYFVDGAAHAKNPDLATEIYNKMVSARVQSNWESEMLLLQGYLKSNKIGIALLFFEEIRKRKEITTKMYNMMIAGLCQAGRPDQAVSFWKEAREKKLIPSLQSYEELSLALCSVKDYNTLFKLFDDFRETGRPVSAFLCNVLLLHMLKGNDLLRVWHKLREESEEKNSCGGLLEELIVLISRVTDTKHNLDKMVEHFETYYPVDLYTYNMLLRVLAIGKRMDLADKLFERLCEKGYKPNRWSYDAMVRGFCNSRNKDEAEKWMESMLKKGFRPTRHAMKLLDRIS